MAGGTSLGVFLSEGHLSWYITCTHGQMGDYYEGGRQRDVRTVTMGREEHSRLHPGIRLQKMPWHRADSMPALSVEVGLKEARGGTAELPGPGPQRVVARSTQFRTEKNSL